MARNLAVRTALVFIPTLTVALIVGLLILYRHTVTQAQANAVETIHQLKILRGYYTANVISKVIAHTTLRVNFDHKENAKTIPLPATLIHDLSALIGAQSKQGINARLYSRFPFPNRASRTLDPFALAAIEAIQRNPDLVFARTEQFQGLWSVRVAIADRMQAAACVTCHNNHPDSPKKDWKIGEVRGVLEITTPIEDDLEAVAGAIVVTFALILGALGTAFLLQWLLLRRASSKIADVSRGLRSLAEGRIGAAGDFISAHTEQMQGKSDEVDGLVQSMAAMHVRLDNAVGTARGSARVLKDALGEFHTSLNHLSENVGNQAASFEEISATIEQMSASGENMAARAGEELGVVGDFDASVDSFQRLMSSTEEKIRNVGERISGMQAEASNSEASLAQMLDTMQNLESSSSQMEVMADIVDDVSEKISLLALNAAIEAARAGDAGRGFSVLAQEITKLAAQAGSSVRTVQDRVEDNRRIVAKSSSDIKGAMQMTGGILRSVGDVAESMNAIRTQLSGHVREFEQVRSVGARATAALFDVAAALEEQKRALAEIEEALNQLNELGQKNAQGGQAILGVSATVEEIAEKLASEMSFFKTSKDTD